jgi:hypothetical protein
MRKGKKFQPTMLNFNYNLCDLTSNFNSTQSQIIQSLYEKWTPHALERIRNLLHPCPYSGRIFFEKSISIIRHTGPTAMLAAIGAVKHVGTIYFNDQIAGSLVVYRTTKNV